MEPRKMTLEQPGRGLQLGRGMVAYFKKENEKLIKRISELEAPVKWTKFDHNDPKTFPPSGGFLGYFTGQCGDKYQDVHFRNDEYMDEEFATRMVYHKLTHWRPLPNDPVETEETK